jgi:transcriptional regulator with XRE-family HTH domain
MIMPQGPAIPRRRLGAELRRLREDVGLSLEQAAAALECSTSKISRLETGKGLPKQRDVRDLVRLYGKTAEGDLERLLRWAREGARAGWWQEYTPLLSQATFVFDGVDRYVALESGASRLTCFDNAAFHGLLQAPDYARTIIRTLLPDYTAEEIEKMVEFRLRRQDFLHRPDGPLRLDTVVDEAVFRRFVGGSEVMGSSSLICWNSPAAQRLPAGAAFRTRFHQSESRFIHRARVRGLR